MMCFFQHFICNVWILCHIMFFLLFHFLLFVMFGFYIKERERERKRGKKKKTLEMGEGCEL
jgi:hypothetical protein